MNYEQALDKIFSFLTFGREPSVLYMRELLNRIGAPDKKLKFVHIAGTNGKGSTCALIAAPLIAAGYKTALFISPFITEFCERFQINGKLMERETLPSIVERVLPAIQAMKNEGKIINEFELVTAIGMTWFAEQNCDIVVLETGLGGRYDATNAIDCPLVSVITSISLDHTAVLGDTVQKIAHEKCGIIKKGGITVAYSEQPENTLEIIRQAAQDCQNHFYAADTSCITPLEMTLNGTTFEYKTNNTSLSLNMRMIGKHQIKNAATALCVLERLKELGFNITNEALAKGFSKAFMPCRLEVVSKNPLIIIDGAHNPDGVRSLTDALNCYLDNTPKIAVVGMLADKDVSHSLCQILPLFNEVITLTPNNRRALSADKLAEIAHQFCNRVTAFENNSDALTYALSKTSDHAVVVFGSLYLTSDLRKELKEFSAFENLDSDFAH